MTYSLALTALADPSRREVFQRLRTGPLSVAAIADAMPISRPAVSQHLKVLKEAGLVNDRSEGARRIYFIERNGLASLRHWLDQFWDEALDSFQAEAERQAAAQEKPGKWRQR